MHRAANDGLRTDRNGETLDPDVARKRLQILGQFTGGDADGTRFDAIMATSFDPYEMRRLQQWRAAYLGRYMHQQVSQLAEMPVDEIMALVHETSELLKAEHPLTTQQQTNG